MGHEQEWFHVLLCALPCVQQAVLVDRLHCDGLVTLHNGSAMTGSGRVNAYTLAKLFFRYAENS
jgi:hypothetical protein